MRAEYKFATKHVKKMNQVAVKDWTDYYQEVKGR